MYNSRDMYQELYDSACMVINQRDMIILTQEEIIASFERTVRNDSVIREQDSVLYSALEQKYKHQKIMTRVFQGSTLLFFLLLLF